MIHPPFPAFPVTTPPRVVVDVMEFFLCWAVYWFLLGTGWWLGVVACRISEVTVSRCVERGVTKGAAESEHDTIDDSIVN